MEMLCSELYAWICYDSTWIFWIFKNKRRRTSGEDFDIMLDEWMEVYSRTSTKLRPWMLSHRLGVESNKELSKFFLSIFGKCKFCLEAGLVSSGRWNCKALKSWLGFWSHQFIRIESSFLWFVFTVDKRSVARNLSEFLPKAQPWAKEETDGYGEGTVYGFSSAQAWRKRYHELEIWKIKGVMKSLKCIRG